jgi:predicted PurR-regulated permease PerM
MTWWQNASPPTRALMVILGAPLLVLNGWAFAAIFNYFRSLITILVGASLLAFLLNYPISFLERRGAKRGPVAVLVFLVAIALLTALGITLLPDAINQAQQLVTRLPELIDSGRRQVIMLNEQAERLGLPLSFDSLFVQISDRLKGQIQAIAGQALNLAVVTVTSLLDFALTLVLAFYLSQHGDEVWAGLISWLPDRVQRPFSQTLRLSFQNFFINQLIIATCMASALVPSFLWLKVPFGLLFGLTIGIMALVPFGGTVGIIIVTTLVTLQNFWLGLQALLAAVIVQQILENLVAPRLLGSFTGLNPVWILIAILTGARIGGLLGVIVSVPIAVVLKTALVALRMPDGEPLASLAIADEPDKSEKSIVDTGCKPTVSDSSVQSLLS